MTTPLTARNLKFRPVLSLEQINHIIDAMTHSDPLTISIRRVLIPLVAKIEVGAISPAYKLSETHALKMAESDANKRYQSGEMTPEEEAEYEAKILGV